MKRYTKYLTPEGIEYAVFPMETLTVTQNPNGTFSHLGIQAMDIAGKDGTIESAYAPVTVTVIAKSLDGSGIIFQSVEQVLFAAGYYDFLTYRCYHDENTKDVAIGKNFPQGSKNYDEGKFGNATGNHIHLTVARGKYAGTKKTPLGKLALVNEVPPWEAFFVNDTIIRNGGGNPWKEYKPMPIKALPTSTARTDVSNLRYRNKPGLDGDKLGMVLPFTNHPCLGIVENIDGYHWARLVIGDQVVYSAISKADGTSPFITVTEIPVYKIVESPVDVELLGSGFTVSIKRP